MQMQWLTLRKFKSKSPDVRFEAVKEMLESGDPRYVDPLLDALKDDWAAIRVVSAEALGKLGDERATEDLVSALQDKDRSVRSSAARALELLGWKPDDLDGIKRDPSQDVRTNAKSDRSRISSLIASLGHPENGTKASIALGSIGETAVAPLLEALGAGDPWMRHNAVIALGAIGDSRSIGKLAELVKEGVPGAACAIAAIGGPEAIEVLFNALESPRTEARAAAANALGKSGEPRAVGPLIEAARKRMNDFDSIAPALGELRDPAAAPFLITNIKREAAANALRSIGSRAVVALIEKLDSMDIEVRRSAAEVLGAIGDPRAIAPLAERIRFGRHILYALEALDWEPANIDQRVLKNLAHGRLDEVLDEGPGALQPLMDAFDNEDMYIRNAASSVMPRFGAAANKKLIDALKDERIRVRTRAASTLAAIGDAKVVAPLIAAMKDDLSVEIVEALGRLGGDRAVNALLSVLRDMEAVALDRSDARKGKRRPAHAERAAAARALGLYVNQEEVLEALTFALDDDNPIVREAALEAAGDSVDSRAVESLLAMLSVERAFVVDKASVQLRISSAVRPAIDALARLSDSRAPSAFLATIRSAAFSSVLEAAVGGLTYLIERAGPSLAEEDLQNVLELPDSQTYSFDDVQNGRAVKKIVTADCTRVKWLAGEELARRQPVILKEAEPQPQSIEETPDEAISVSSALVPELTANPGVAQSISHEPAVKALAVVAEDARPRPAVAANLTDSWLAGQDILVICDCGERAYVRAQFAGKRGKCKVCGGAVTVPELNHAARV
jgi:HEAT repeat protein